MEEDGARDQGEEAGLEPRARRAEGGGRGEVSRVGDRGWSQSAGGIGCGGGAEAPGEKEPRRWHGGSGGPAAAAAATATQEAGQSAAQRCAHRFGCGLVGRMQNGPWGFQVGGCSHLS